MAVDVDQRPEPFDHCDWLLEVKHDGFRAVISGRRTAV